jgi:adenylate kinase family enzyme
MKRAETSGRSDDNQDTIIKRFTAYNEQSKPVKEFYARFGKVREIESNGDPLEIYEQTRRAMLPQISCIIGPKACGKTALGAALCDRTNMKLVNFNNFVEDNKLEDEDDEVVTSALIKMLSREISPRVLLEDFPQSEYQAKFFIKNCTTPSRVFSLECSKDICQERMIQVASQAGSYQSSSILSKKIRLYKENSAKLLPYLKGATNFKTVNTE